jgi:elongation factor P
MRDGSVIERTFRAGEKFQEAYIEKHTLQYLYRTSNTYHLMDTKSYEEVQVPAEALGPSAGFLKENMELEGQFHEGQMIGIQPPMFVDVQIESTEPGVRGDTSKAGMKPAKLETGATIQVPLFVENGDLIRVDTRNGTYVSRV